VFIYTPHNEVHFAKRLQPSSLQRIKIKKYKLIGEMARLEVLFFVTTRSYLRFSESWSQSWT